MPYTRGMTQTQKRRARAAARSCVVVYLRVSTDEQVRSGLGLDAQEASCRAYAAAQGWTVVAVIVEDALGGKVHPSKRPGYRRALTILEGCEAGTLLVLREDRLSRRLRHLLDVLGAAEESAWQVATVDNGVLNEEKDGLSIHVRGAVAEHERRLIGKRTRDALAALKAQGVTLGAAPQIPDEIGRRIHAEHAAGRSMRTIAAGLTAEGVPTARGGSAWSHASVQAVLRAVRYSAT